MRTSPPKTAKSSMSVTTSQSEYHKLMWRECIKKVWEVDPLTCLECTGEMRIISFIYKKTAMKKIFIHLNIFEEKKNQRAPPRAVPDNRPPEIVLYDDGWPGYDEPVFDF